jgi:hypothetical protein
VAELRLGAAEAEREVDTVPLEEAEAGTDGVMEREMVEHTVLDPLMLAEKDGEADALRLGMGEGEGHTLTEAVEDAHLEAVKEPDDETDGV